MLDEMIKEGCHSTIFLDRWGSFNSSRICKKYPNIKRKENKEEII